MKQDNNRESDRGVYGSGVVSLSLPPAAAYVHVPFCRRRCFYCDFPISVIGDRRSGENSLAVQSYVQEICREIAATPNLAISSFTTASHATSGTTPPSLVSSSLALSDLATSDLATLDPAPPNITTSHQGIALQTIFFGGGTPSLLTAAQCVQILETLDQQFGIATNAEISIELDPGTFDAAKLNALAEAGFNRVSMGVQSFNDDLLQVIGRSHTVAEIEAAIELLQGSAITNFSLDLMAGLPHQSLKIWEQTLERAIAYHPPHLSYYDLIIEPGTVFDRYYQPGTAPLPRDEDAAQMYRLAQQYLTAAGYEHYEISNYAQPGYACQHNLTYWHNQAYYGFGQGATSYTQGQRVSRPRTRAAYQAWLTTYEADGGVLTEPIVSPVDSLLESLMLGLRTAAGLTITPLQDILLPEGRTAWAVLQPVCTRYAKQGWVTIEPSRVRLTDPEGFLHSNTVLSALFAAIETAWKPRP